VKRSDGGRECHFCVFEDMKDLNGWKAVNKKIPTAVGVFEDPQWMHETEDSTKLLIYYFLIHANFNHKLGIVRD
jgi:hypothetical protein